MKEGRTLTIAAVFMLVTAAGGWAGGAGEADTAPGAGANPGAPSVVASTSILGDVVRNIAGDTATVITLMDLGEDPHSYEPGPGDLRLIEDADVVFLNGLNLEEGLLDDVETIASGRVVEVSAGIDIHEDDHDGHDHGGADPHVWTDPANVMEWVWVITAALGEIDPDNATAYTQRGEDYIAELAALDEEIRELLSVIPETDRKLVTDHETLGAFAAAYGFTVVATITPGTSSTAEPSARRVADLVGVVERERVSAIFVGTTAGRGILQLSDAITDEAGREVRVMPLLTGSLAAPGEPGDSYLGFMRYNALQILSGLGGS